MFDENTIGKSDYQNFFIQYILQYCPYLARIDSLDDPLQQVSYVLDSPVSWLYYPSSATTGASISDRDIHWTADVVVDGEDKMFNKEYPNPADMNTVFFDVGGGVHTFSCFHRMSPVTVLGSLQLALKGKIILSVLTCQVLHAIYDPARF